jgi:glycosyltransferase involved in cell wall biosynthesis
MHLDSLIYVSRGNIPSQVAHASQIVKMSQAFAQRLEKFELVASGDLKHCLKGVDQEFKDFYNLTTDFGFARLPIHYRANIPFPKSYESRWYNYLATIYACLKSPSLIYARTPSIVSSLLKIGVPVLWEWHESIPEGSAYQRFLSSRSLVGMVTIADKLAENYISLGLPEDKVLVAHNGVDLTSFQPYQTKEEARDPFSFLKNKKVVLYAGHLYESKGIPTLIQTAKLMPHCSFVLVGGWESDVQRYRKICQEQNLTNVYLLGHTNQQALVPYLYAADVLVLPTSGTWNLANVTSPLKLFEYMAVKRPIVASALPNVMSILRSHKNAILAEPDNPDSFHQAIDTLLSIPEWSTQLAEQAFRDVQQYTWEARADRILDFATARLANWPIRSETRKRLFSFLLKRFILSM